MGLAKEKEIIETTVVGKKWEIVLTRRKIIDLLIKSGEMPPVEELVDRACISKFVELGEEPFKDYGLEITYRTKSQVEEEVLLDE